MVGERTIQNAPAATLTRLAERDSGAIARRAGEGRTIGRALAGNEAPGLISTFIGG